MTDRDHSGYRVDFHVKVLDGRVVDRARARDLDAIVYAPHFTRLPEIRRESTAWSSEDLLVVPAREVFTGTWRNRKHVLALGLTEPVPDFIPLDAAMAEFDRQGATVLVPHPAFATVSLTAADVERYRDVIDAVETYNPKLLPWNTRRATDISTALDIPSFVSSYAHLRRTVGVAHTVFDRPIVDETDLLATLADGTPRRLVTPTGTQRLTTSALELAHLAFENTWHKLDRILLSGQEATHPHHIAYEGRFDDVAVY